MRLDSCFSTVLNVQPHIGRIGGKTHQKGHKIHVGQVEAKHNGRKYIRWKIAVFWDVTPCGVCYVFLRSVRRLPITGNFVPSSPILVTLMIEAIRSSATSVLTKAI
jgi:hypothetical protein